MSFINKQKFLAELGRLLTFMYEEDRLVALAEYERMFEASSNEQLLIQLLVSPTKQAVMLARSYEAKDRKLQIKSDSRSANQGERPEFMTVLERIRSEVFSKLPAENTQVQPATELNPAENAHSSPDVQEEQISFLDEASQQSEVYPASQEQSENTPKPLTERKPTPTIASSGDIISDIALTMREIEQQSNTDTWDKDNVVVEVSPDVDVFTADSKNKPELDLDMDFGFAEELNSMQSYFDESSFQPIFADNGPTLETDIDIDSASPALEETQVSPESNVYETLEIDYTVSEKIQSASETISGNRIDTPLEATDAEPTSEPAVPFPSIGISSSTEVKASTYDSTEDELYDEPEKELKPFIFVLYLILAIPLGLLGIVFLLLPSFLCLSLGIGLGFFAVLVLGALSSGFVVLADILAVGGAGLLLLALTLLMLWLFVWFIGGAIVGLIRALISLGESLCLKEVSEE